MDTHRIVLLRRLSQELFRRDEATLDESEQLMLLNVLMQEEFFIRKDVDKFEGAIYRVFTVENGKEHIQYGIPFSKLSEEARNAAENALNSTKNQAMLELLRQKEK